MNSSEVVHELVPGVPGDYFRCDHYGLMSVAACQRYFGEAPGLVSKGRLINCIGCSAGAMHASGGSGQPFVSDGICVRCRRDPSNAEQYRSTRQGRIRMVRGGLLCVSCFNREREVVLGRNARKNAPRAAPLIEFTIGCIQAGRQTVTKTLPVKDGIEAALTVMRMTKGSAMVGWASSGVVRTAYSSEAPLALPLSGDVAGNA